MKYYEDGRFIEKVGTYNPMVEPAEIKIDAEKVQEAADILRGLQEYGEGTIPLYIKPNNMPS